MGGTAKKTKLKKLEVNSVDLVPSGANPDAHINLFKSKEERPAWDRFVGMVKKSLGMDEADIEEVVKSHYTFEQQKNKVDLRKIENELWDYTSALRESFSSILTDPEVGQQEKETLLKKSVDEFVAATNEVIPLWSRGQEALQKSFDDETVELYKQLEIESLEERLEILKAGDDDEEEEDFDDLDDLDDDDEEEEEPDEPEEEKEATKKMKIDKSLLTYDEQQFLNEVIQKAAVDDDYFMEEQPTEVMKAMTDRVAELEKQLAMKEMETVAKGYDILGKDTAELAKSLYTMKQAGEDAYNEFVNALDIAKSAKENSGLFTEIGKSHTESASGVMGKVNAAAAEIRKADPSLSMTEAIAKAWEQNPDFVKEYDNENGVM